MRELINRYFVFSTLEYTGVDFPIGAVLFAVTLGLCAAVFAIYFYKRAMHLLIKRLIRKGAFSEESARSLAELRLGEKSVVKRMLSGGGKLKTLVRRRGEVALSYEEYIRLQKEEKKNKRKSRDAKQEKKEADRYYIPEDAMNAARRVYEEGAPSVFSPILSSFLILFFFVLIMLLVPYVLEFLF